MMNNRISFSVDADSISLKSIYKKDFLELQMRAISTANPNLNGSWFTKESLEDAVESCRNKPILGYFNSDGDFESHNGTWRKDVETGLNYWDTQDGEQIIGIIRENDDVKVIEGEDGLYWLCLSCALWTQYNFKQVKRLIKDAKRAKENGGVTKNISVEIDIKEGEQQENGIYRIDKFTLAGITILGSRKGKQVLPGIADAALSIPEILGKDFYEQQQNAIRAAYERLDNANFDDGEEEEDILNMDMTEQNNNISENIQNTDNLETVAEPAKFEEACPDCGKNPCECAKDDQEQQACGGEDAGEPATQNACDGDKDQEQQACGDDGDDKENLAADEDKDNDDDKEKDGDNDSDKDNDDDKEKDKEQNFGMADVAESEEVVAEAGAVEVRDVAWLVEAMTYGFNEINSTIHYYEYMMESHPEDAPHGAYIVSVLKRVLAAQTKIEGTLGGLLAKIGGEITEADEQYETKLTEYENIEELIEKYEKEVSLNEELNSKIEEYSKENEDMKTRLDQFAHNEFMTQVNNLIQSTKDLDENVGKEIYELCENGTLHTFEEVKTKVALALFEAQQTFDNTSSNISIQAPVEMPDIQAAFEAKAEKSQKRDSWTIMREHFGKKSE